MFPDLPLHLQSLNTVSTSPPSSAMNAEYEDAFFDYLHTDDLFRNFSVQPEPESEEKHVEPVKDESTTTTGPADLKSFIAQFANDPNMFGGNDFPINLPLPYANTAGPSDETSPLEGIDTATIMPHPSTPWDDALGSEDGRVTGAKRLKSLGAQPVEIEEDKRRRNTEASARFRAKKKEREQNLERRAKDLEAQVAKLAAEKSSLENENKLLKSIVLGSGATGGQDALQAALAAFGGAGAKRKRD